MGGSIGGFAKDMGNKNVTDPTQAQWGDLSGGEKGARLTSGVIQGLSNGLQNRQAQMRPQPGAPPIQVQPTPQSTQQFDPNFLLNRQQPPMGPRNAMPYSNSEAFYGR